MFYLRFIAGNFIQRTKFNGRRPAPQSQRINEGRGFTRWLYYPINNPMPAKYIIDAKHRVVFSKGLGVFTYREALDYMQQLFNDESFRPEYNQVVDCREATKVELTGEQVRDLAIRSRFSLASRRAFVVSTDIQFGLSRMFAAYRENKAGGAIEVFHSMAEALGWLGLPADIDPHPSAVPGEGTK
jgi:hypothetical protein